MNATRAVGLGALSGNTALPWSIDFIERYKERWDWRRLSENEALPWSIDFIERYEERWDWKSLSRNTSITLEYRLH